jgi:hypothetical protein
MTEIFIAPTRQGTVNLVSGSSALVGNDTDFTAEDIGKQIRIRTSEGIKLFSITDVASSTSITISPAATLTQSHCYYNTDFKTLDVSGDVSMPVTYSVFDISEPDKRGGTLSKTLVLPGTKQNNIIFNHIFEIDTDGTFNPNIKADTLIYQDGIEIFRGSFRLMQVNRLGDRITYECVVLGRVTNIYSAFGDKKLSDLDLSAYDHDYTQSVQADSWTHTADDGYVYPMIDYGETDNSNQAIWQVNQLYPAVFVKALIDQMFALAGYTYHSNFFNSSLFKKLIIPFNAGTFKYSEDEVATRLFEASKTSGTASVITYTTDQYLTIPYNDNSTDPDFDLSSQFSTSGHYWTVLKSGHYNINVQTLILANFHNTSGTTTDLDFPGWIEIVITRGGTPLAVDPSMQDDISAYLHYNGTDDPFNATIDSLFENQYLLSGDVVSVRLHLKSSIPTFTLQVAVQNGSSVYNTVLNNGMAEGDQVVMKDAVPHDVKLADFFRSVTNMFNLYIDEDKEIPNRLNIEPRNDFYAQGALMDWTEKWDTGKPVNLLPMGELTAKNYLFTYHADTDYWNDKYSKKFIQKDHNERYGEYWFGVDNDFLTNSQSIGLLFAPTVLSRFVSTSPVLSSIRFTDSNSSSATGKTTPKNSEIRILYYDGLKAGSWAHRGLSTGTPVDTSRMQYPYAGHFDDPVNPTIDINFGLPAELYYTAKGQSVTDNNLYNIFYSSHFDEITDKDSKVVDMYLHLNPADIHNLDFRDQFFIAGQYYRLVEIADYDLVNPAITRCRFLKVKTGRIFESTTHVLNGGKGGSIGNQRIPMLDFSGIHPMSGLIIGNNNQSKNGGVLITGNGNDITGKNVQVFGANNNVVNANNVTLINSSGLTISEDGSTYIDGEKYVKASVMCGQTTLVDGTIIVNFTGITTSSIILVSYSGSGLGVLSVVPSTDLFTINSTISTDDSDVNWYVVKI